MDPSLPPSSFGGWLKRQRRLLDLTQAELGRLAGCSGAAVRKFEAGERSPSRQLAALLAAALQIPPAQYEQFLKMARGMYTTADEAPVPGFTGSLGGPVAADHLPHPLTSLVDRVNDSVAVAARLADPAVRWLTLIGPPGIGKTRLSIQAGRQALPDFTAGARFVDLAPLEKPEHVLPALTHVLADLGIPASAGYDDLAHTLRDLPLLLVMDNFEHLPSAAVALASLLKRCPQLKVLATSRLPLRIYGEHRYPVPPLSTPAWDDQHSPQSLMDYEAVQLFVARVRQHQPGFRVTPANAAQIVDVCATLEGLPLALELAAASLQHMSLKEMSQALHHLAEENWISRFADPAPDLPTRQHTLENVLAWSYRLLGEDEKALFSALSVFSGWFDMATVCAICFEHPPAPPAVRGLLDSLADHSLLVREDLDGTPRWRMLEIIHEYAALQVEPSRRASLETRFADWFRTALQLPQPPVFYKKHTANLHTALKWYITNRMPGPGFEMAERMGDLWSSWGLFRQGLDLLERLFALPDESPPQVRARRLEQAADLAWQVSDFDTALNYSRQAVDIGQRCNLKEQYPWFLNRLGRIYIEQGEFDAARQSIQQCYDLAKADSGLLNPGIPLAQLGEIAFFEHRLDEAQSTLEGALALLPAGENIFLAICCTDLAEIALARQEYMLARTWLEKAPPHARQQMRRMLVLVCALAGWLVLAAPSPQANQHAARLYGALDGWSRRSGVRLNAFYQALNQPRIQLVRQRLGPAAWQEEFETGSRWDWETLIDACIISA